MASPHVRTAKIVACATVVTAFAGGLVAQSTVQIVRDGSSVLAPLTAVDIWVLAAPVGALIFFTLHGGARSGWHLAGLAAIAFVNLGLTAYFIVETVQSWDRALALLNLIPLFICQAILMCVWVPVWMIGVVQDANQRAFEKHRERFGPLSS